MCQVEISEQRTSVYNCESRFLEEIYLNKEKKDMKMMKQMKKSLSYILCVALIVAMAMFAGGCRDDKKTEGKKTFTFTVVDLEGKSENFEVTTEEDTVGAALLAEGLIEGEESTYGLYVKTVNGITLDYDKDGAYWAFYVNDEYAMSGVDTTEITEGESYAFKAEKS